MHYTGELIRVSWDMMGNKTIKKSKADGRAMIDRQSYKRMVPSGYGNLTSDIPGCSCADCAAQRGVDVTADDADEEDDEAQLTTMADKDATDVGPEAEHDIVQISQEELTLLPSTVFGFSFHLKGT